MGKVIVCKLNSKAYIYVMVSHGFKVHVLISLIVAWGQESLVYHKSGYFCAKLFLQKWVKSP